MEKVVGSVIDGGGRREKGMVVMGEWGFERIDGGGEGGSMNGRGWTGGGRGDGVDEEGEGECG